MLLVGFLFGLGFDTASEIGLLGLSAQAAAHTGAGWSIMAPPALFTAGMSLADTVDGVIMARAYGWALERPSRRAGYNLTVTGVSVAAALVVAALERGEPWGVWGGEILDRGSVLARKRPRGRPRNDEVAA
jgi:high-affinity nickel-transport protein